jgi:hypothetical protein
MSRNAGICWVVFCAWTVASWGGDLPELPDLPILDAEPTPTAPSAPVADPVPLKEPSPVEPENHPVQAPPQPSARWATPGQAPLVDLGEVVEHELPPPPFDVLATTRSVDISGRWWMPDVLKVRGVPLSGDVSGPQLRWKRAENGQWGVVLRSRYRISDLRRMTKTGLQKPREVEISQGIAFTEVRDGRWQVTSSPFVIHWIEGEGDGNLSQASQRSEILPSKEAKGLWQSWIPQEGLVVVGWTESAFNAVREELSDRLANEELRILLAKGGEVVWVIRPKSPPTEEKQDNNKSTSTNPNPQNQEGKLL